MSSHSARGFGRGHSGPGSPAQLQEPAPITDQKQQKQGLGQGELQKYSNREAVYQGLKFFGFINKNMGTNISLERKKFGHKICIIQEIKLDDHSDHSWPHNILILKLLSFSLFFPMKSKELRKPILHLLDFTIHLSLLILHKSWKSNIFLFPTSGNNQNFVQHYVFYSNTHK